MQDLSVGILQFDQCWEDKLANFNKINTLVASNKHLDILLLPEMFHTGFTMNISLAESMNGLAIDYLTDLAKKNDVAIYTSIIIADDGNFYNRGVFVKPDGEISIYDKRKSFCLGDEDKYFTEGTTQNIVTYKHWKINLQICYDLRFPELVRNMHVQGSPAYDLLLYVANWPAKRILHWDTLIKARAIENQCYVIACNRVGTDGNQLYYNGHSQAQDMFGDAMLTPQEQEGLYIVKLSAAPLLEGRNNLPFLRDA